VENLVQSLGRLMTPDVINQLSTMIGSDKTTTSRAMSAVGPTLVGALSRVGGTDAGAQSVMNLLKNAPVDSGNLTSLSSLLSDPKTLSQVTGAGGSMVESLLGSNATSVTNAIGGLTGLSGGSVDQLMKVGAPMLLAVVGKAVKGGNLDNGGLATLLSGQKGFVNQSLPNGLDLNSLLGKAPAAPKAASKSGAPAKKSGGKIPWLWIGLGVVALALIGYLIWNSLNGGGAATADPATVSGTVTKLDRAALPDDAVITVLVQDTSLADAPAVDIGQQVIDTEGDQLPIAYAVAYDEAEIEDSQTYTVRAEIRDGAGELLYVSDTSIPVISQGNPTSDVEIPEVPAN
jgi:putative lipoprotein